jgi:hypothetical protein
VKATTASKKATKRLKELKRQEVVRQALKSSFSPSIELEKESRPTFAPQQLQKQQRPAKKLATQQKKLEDTAKKPQAF